MAIKSVKSDLRDQGTHQSMANEDVREYCARRNMPSDPYADSKVLGNSRKVMRMAHGIGYDPRIPSNAREDMPKSTKIIEQYEDALQKGKVRATGLLSDNVVTSSWPESAKQSARRREARGLTTRSFLELLKGPADKRPTNFRQCVNFFYPESGYIPPTKDISPFISTSIAGYVAESPSKPGNIPLQLGEVSMMYGWYLAFRLMLCPKEFEAEIDALLAQDSDNRENRIAPFHTISQGRFIDPNQDSKVRRKFKADEGKLIAISKGVSFVEDMAKGVASGAIDLSGNTDISQVAKDIYANATSIQDALKNYGTTAVASILTSQLSVPYKFANDIASVVMQGGMAVQKWQDILNDTEIPDVNSALRAAARASKNILTNYTRDVLEDAGIDRRFTNAMSTFIVTGDLNADTIMEGAGATAKQYYDAAKSVIRGAPDSMARTLGLAQDRVSAERLVKLVDQKIAEKRARFTASYDEFEPSARENPEPLTMLLIGTTASLIQGGIEYQRAKNRAARDAALNYLRENVVSIDEILVASDAAFDFGTHVNEGVWGNGEWYGALKPHCLLNQGGQVLDYWVHVWRRVKQATQTIRNFQNTYGSDQFPSLYSFARPEIQGKYEEYVEDPNVRFGVVTVPTDFTGERNTRCQQLGIFAQNVMGNIVDVIENMPNFSPFTHAYGFAPAVRLAPDGTFFVDGKPLRKFAGRNDFMWIGKGHAIASAAPGRLYPLSRLRAQQGFGQRVVDCKLRHLNGPSRRLIEGSYGQRCSLSFDVGIRDNAPVMGAQFCGLMAVLLCHPEAIISLRRIGVSWANDIPTAAEEVISRIARSTGSGILSSLIKPALKLNTTGPLVRKLPVSINLKKLATPSLDMSKLGAQLKIDPSRLKTQLKIDPDVLKKIEILKNTPLIDIPEVKQAIEEVSAAEDSRAKPAKTGNTLKYAIGATAILATLAGAAVIVRKRRKGEL